MKKPYLILFLSLIFITSCDRLNPVEKQLDNFVSDLESQKTTLTTAEWENADQTIEAFRQKIDASRNNMTVEQIASSNKAIGRYTALRLKSGLKDFKNSLDDLGDQLKGMVEELVDTTQK